MGWAFLIRRAERVLLPDRQTLAAEGVWVTFRANTISVRAVELEIFQ